MILIHPGPLSPGVHLAARSLITRPSSFLSIRSFSARSMSSRDEPTTQSGFSSSPSNAGTLTSTRPRVTALVAAPLPSGPSGTLPSDATGRILPVAVVVVVSAGEGRDGSEQTPEDGVSLAKRPVDDRVVRVVQHVERDVHQLEVPHQQRLLPVRELVVRYPRPVLVLLVVPRPSSSSPSSP